MIDPQRSPLVLLLRDPLRWLPSDFMLEIDIVRGLADIDRMRGTSDAVAVQIRLRDMVQRRRREVVMHLEEQAQKRAEVA